MFREYVRMRFKGNADSSATGGGSPQIRILADFTKFCPATAMLPIAVYTSCPEPVTLRLRLNP